ncbi:MAG: 3-hydroxyacyl-ACP dehydratase [Dehalococcoidales bacterium]|nr:3-hydroxyacyl-ACP dehydratase [Dehalococcoidales bacterium]
MITAGLDIGSRTIALVEWDGKRVIREEVVFTGMNPVENANRLISGRHYDYLVATGYGRHLAKENSIADEVISEITAYAFGACTLYPDAGTILDIGGQDSKVILIGSNGSVANFEMNDRCAAGTGRFLENMAAALSIDVKDMGEYALEAQGEPVTISNMCTVFAETEVISYVSRGVDSHQIGLGIHKSIANRVTAMVRRVGLRSRFVFAGGVALNPCMRKLISEALLTEVIIPDSPQTLGAFGAAMKAVQKIS